MQPGELKGKSRAPIFGPQLTRIRFPASIFRGLYFARNWQAVANQQIYPTLATLLTAGRAHGFTDPYVLPQKPVAPLPATAPDAPGSYPVEAISGADGVASNGVPLKKAFDDLVETTRDHAPTCKSSILSLFEGRWVDRGL